MTGVRINRDRLKGTANGVQLAQRLGVHQTTLSRKLNGKMPLTLEELNEAAEFLHLEFSVSGHQANSSSFSNLSFHHTD